MAAYSWRRRVRRLEVQFRRRRPGRSRPGSLAPTWRPLRERPVAPTWRALRERVVATAERCWGVRGLASPERLGRLRRMDPADRQR